MGNYYYLAAQLPYLVYGQEIPMTSSAFKTFAWGQMNPVDAAMLDYCTLDPCPEESASSSEQAVKGRTAYAEPAPATSSEFINRWKEWERALRLNLAKGRALRFQVEHKREGTIEAPDLPVDAVAAAKNALAMESPLEAELLLNKARWDAVESFQGLNVFSQDAIYAYVLKLLLLERKAAFITEEGFTEYKGLYAAILERYRSAEGAGTGPDTGSKTTEPGEPK
ncbi:MAG: hypothetical protein FWC45_06960 [Treponema sp.]|nr:hypothetical protein [Treponema sp.]